MKRALSLMGTLGSALLLPSASLWAEGLTIKTPDLSLLDLMGKLALGLGGFLILYYFLRRRRDRNIEGSMRSIGFLPLGGRERVVLLEVEGERFLLGVSEGRINLLTRFHKGGVMASLRREEGELSGQGWTEGSVPFDFDGESPPWKPLPEVVKAIEQNFARLKRGRA